MLLPLSGNYASVGADNKQGIDVAVDLLDARQILALSYGDSKAEAAVAVSEFRKLTADDRVVAVFAMRGPVGMAINPLSKNAGIPLLGGVGNKDFASANEYAFQFWPRSDEEGAFLANVIAKQGFKKVSLITAQDDWPTAVSQGFRDELSKLKISVVYDQEIVPADTDFRTAIAQLRSKSADVVFANVGLAQIGPFLRQAKEQKLTLPTYSNYFIAKKDVVESAGSDLLEGVRFVEMSTDLPTLQKELQSRYGSNPSGATLSAYVATYLLVQSAKADPSIRTARDLYSTMLKQSEVRTPDGSFPIIDRKIKFPLVVKIMHGGKGVPEQGA